MRRARPGPLRATFVSIACLFRSLSLFLFSSPRTPLRILCVAALDTIHVLRESAPLSREVRQDVASLLDFQAVTNAIWDRKPFRADEYEALRQRLDARGRSALVAAYLSRLGEVEARRPVIGGDFHCCDDVRRYRESAVRLSPATLVAMTSADGCIESAIRATSCESDVATLFQLAMLCQVIDDVLDYREDLSAGLPSFLTASSSLPAALVSTAEAVQSYATPAGAAAGGVLPLQVGRVVLSTAAKALVGLCRWKRSIGAW